MVGACSVSLKLGSRKHSAVRSTRVVRERAVPKTLKASLAQLSVLLLHNLISSEVQFVLWNELAPVEVVEGVDVRRVFAELLTQAVNERDRERRNFSAAVGTDMRVTLSRRFLEPVGNLDEGTHH